MKTKRTPLDILNVLRDKASQVWYDRNYEDIKSDTLQVIIHEWITGNFPKRLQRIRYGVYKLYDGTVLYIRDLGIKDTPQSYKGWCGENYSPIPQR